MHIVMMTSSLGAGGAERVASTLCNEWIENGHAVTLIATFSGGGNAFYPLSPKIRVLFLADLVPKQKKSFVSYWRRFLVLRKLVLSDSVGVVVSFLPNVNVAAILATAFTKVPVIVSERRDPASQPTSRFWEIACTIFYRFSDAVVVQTETVLQSIESSYPSLKKVVCIPNPLPSKISQISHKQVSRSRQILLSIGRLDAAKQVEHCIEAFKELAIDHVNWDLHIYGDGPMKASLILLIKKFGLQNRVFLMGKTTNPWSVMANADAFVMTSMREGFPNALLEAMGVGLPCVVYDCLSGPREISCDGAGASLVPLNDQISLVKAIRCLMDDGNFRKELGCRARSCVFARYEYQIVLNQWNTLFRDIGVLT